MALFLDARVPVVFGGVEDAAADDALLVEGDLAVAVDRPVARFDPVIAGHAIGCACCVPRGAAATALAGLFVARARGAVPFFRRVVVVPRDENGTAAVREALAGDPLTAGRFRIAGE